MDMSASSLVASLFVSSIGAGLFIYGKRCERWPQLVCGAALSLFPLCVSGAVWMLTISAVLLLGLWQAVRSGW